MRLSVKAEERCNERLDFAGKTLFCDRRSGHKGLHKSYDGRTMTFWL